MKHTNHNIHSHPYAITAVGRKVLGTYTYRVPSGNSIFGYHVNSHVTFDHGLVVYFQHHGQ